MPNEKLEKLKHEQYVAERKLTAAKHKEKRLESEIKRLTRSERTHRLCTRAGMLETFLREPTILTDDDVMELLTFIFHSEAVQKKLNIGKDLLEDFGPLELPAAKLGESGMFWSRIVKVGAEEPAVGDIETDLFTQLPLGIDRGRKPSQRAEGQMRKEGPEL